MNWDDIIYLSLLVASIICGHLLREMKDASRKQNISTVIGLCIVFAVSGVHALHPIVVTCVNNLIVLVSKRHCHVLSFAFCFSYLAVFRLVHMLGYVEEEHRHLNAIQMMHTLKMVAVAFDIRDSHKKQNNRKNSDQDSLISQKNPSFLGMFHYAFCHIGILTGPFYTFRTYSDWLHKPYSRCVPVIDKLYGRIKVIPLYICGLLIGTHFFPLEYTKLEIYSASAAYRWWYMTPLFFNFRMRLYIAFVLSECCCIASGLGMYPTASNPKPGQGPSDGNELIVYDGKSEEALKQDDFNFETIHNVDEYGTEATTTVRDVLKCWNMTVQYWLAFYVYKRVRVFRVAFTMLTSAFWHGMYTGYYVGLLTVPLALTAEASMASAVRKYLSPEKKKFYDSISWLIRTQIFCYMGMGFFLVYSGSTIYYWKSMYFFGHVLLVLLYALGSGISVFRGKIQHTSRSNDKVKSG